MLSGERVFTTGYWSGVGDVCKEWGGGGGGGGGREKGEKVGGWG